MLARIGAVQLYIAYDLITVEQSFAGKHFHYTVRSTKNCTDMHHIAYAYFKTSISTFTHRTHTH